jgi:hypothetical protein
LAVLSLHAARLSTNGTHINTRVPVLKKCSIRRVLTDETLLQLTIVIGGNHGKRLRQSELRMSGKPTCDADR